MKFKIEIWTIQDIINEYYGDNLFLNPPYQRKFIWSLDDQQTLIDSILKGFAIPNIFLYQTDTKYEMVDGQQRTRTILNFFKQGFTTESGKLYSKTEFPDFLKYQIPVTVITDITKDEPIWQFYNLVNKSGIHLNRPELKRSEYFDTNFLKLVNELSALEEFKELDLFTESSEKRLNDTDFVSELITLLKLGISDKKNSVDSVFEKDIDDKEFAFLKSKFTKVINIVGKFNNVYPIKKTRFKQRNDFYTLISFLDQNSTLKPNTLLTFYNTLLIFNNDINPSNEKCEPFQEYAFHCVSQSNSKNARIKRFEILNSFFINPSLKENSIQSKILGFYGLKARDMVRIEGNLTFNNKKFPKQ